ncbi:hypothetical protein PHLCEN_2v8565 [Hermanssonia centrifuga]|uniref:Uncharacterized protein n=1 Tax=Hermanssonia centrifuga TaxID=98765 RepID=A0A2R6NTA3_9APHY|nr:hypothetical protein PHLCEN_2v8565 [Hermanssonia centrifuga]
MSQPPIPGPSTIETTETGSVTRVNSGNTSQGKTCLMAELAAHWIGRFYAELQNRPRLPSCPPPFKGIVKDYILEASVKQLSRSTESSLSSDKSTRSKSSPICWPDLTRGTPWMGGHIQLSTEVVQDLESIYYNREDVLNQFLISRRESQHAVDDHVNSRTTQNLFPKTDAAESTETSLLLNLREVVYALEDHMSANDPQVPQKPATAATIVHRTTAGSSSTKPSAVNSPQKPKIVNAAHQPTVGSPSVKPSAARSPQTPHEPAKVVTVARHPTVGSSSGKPSRAEFVRETPVAGPSRAMTERATVQSASPSSLMVRSQSPAYHRPISSPKDNSGRPTQPTLMDPSSISTRDVPVKHKLPAPKNISSPPPPPLGPQPLPAERKRAASRHASPSSSSAVSSLASSTSSRSSTPILPSPLHVHTPSPIVLPQIPLLSFPSGPSNSRPASSSGPHASEQHIPSRTTTSSMRRSAAPRVPSSLRQVTYASELTPDTAGPSRPRILQYHATDQQHHDRQSVTYGFEDTPNYTIRPSTTASEDLAQYPRDYSSQPSPSNLVSDWSNSMHLQAAASTGQSSGTRHPPATLPYANNLGSTESLDLGGNMVHKFLVQRNYQSLNAATLPAGDGPSARITGTQNQQLIPTSRIKPAKKPSPPKSKTKRKLEDVLDGRDEPPERKRRVMSDEEAAIRWQTIARQHVMKIDNGELKDQYPPQFPDTLVGSSGYYNPSINPYMGVPNVGTPEGYYFPSDVNNGADFYASGLQSGSSPQVPPELLQLYSVGVPAAGATGIQNQQTSPPNRYQSREKSSRPPAASRQPSATGSKPENRPDKGKGREQPTQPSAYLSKQEKRIDKGKGREQPTQPHAYFNETVDPIFMAAPDSVGHYFDDDNTYQIEGRASQQRSFG